MCPDKRYWQTPTHSVSWQQQTAILLFSLVVNHIRCLAALQAEHAQLQVLELFRAVLVRCWHLTLPTYFGSDRLFEEHHVMVDDYSVNSSISAQTCSSFLPAWSVSKAGLLQKDLVAEPFRLVWTLQHKSAACSAMHHRATDSIPQ